MTHTPIRLLPLLAAFAPAVAFAQVQLPDDHVDLGVGYDDGALALHWHDEAGDNEYAPGEAFAFVPLASSLIRPAGSQWDFTGAAAGGTIYLAPAVQTSGVIFLGIGSEEITDDLFVGNALTLTLDSVSGPGEFSLWQTDGFGSPVVGLSTVDEVLSISLTTGGHAHYNWGFTETGLYQLTFTVSGILDDGANTFVSDTATYTFAIGATPVPEPASFAVFGGLVALGFSAARRRRA